MIEIIKINQISKLEDKSFEVIQSEKKIKITIGHNTTRLAILTLVV